MNYAELESKGLIHRYQGSKNQVAQRLELAERDIQTAQQIVANNWDWAYSIAYNAMLQAGRALMFHKGYRPVSGEGAHLAVVQFAEIALGKILANEINLFNKMRRKRHQAVYDAVGMISQEETRQAIGFAREFVNLIKQTIDKPAT